MLRRLSLLALLAIPLLSCSALEPVYAGVVVRFRESAPLVRERMVVTITSAETQWYLEGTDLEEEADGWLVSRELRIPPGGTSEVQVSFRGEGSTAASAGRVTLPIPRDARWRVDVFASSENPANACAGCDGISQFPIGRDYRPSARDWLFVRWTGIEAEPDTRRYSATITPPDQEQ